MAATQLSDPRLAIAWPRSIGGLEGRDGGSLCEADLFSVLQAATSA
jgi:hypothetical protein